MPPNTQTPMAIVGLACRFPGADDEASYWTLIEKGINTITEIPPSRWEVAPVFDPKAGTIGKMSSRYGGFIDRFDKFDAEFFGMNPREARIADPQQRVMMELSWQALENAGVDPKALGGSRCGVFIGVSTWDYNKLLNRDLNILDGYVGPGSSLSILANRISYFLDLRGPSMAIDTACSSSLVALHLAAQSLASGESDRALVGGVNLMLSPETNITFSVAGFMSPVGRCKTFAADADGYVRSEGAAVLVLRRLDDAIRDGDLIWGVVRGSAVNQDGASNGLTSPNGAAQQAVIREAFRAAGVEPADIDYVELHGTGTPIGDPIEVRALCSVLKQGRDAHRPCLLGAVKANIGHCEAAAGMAGLIKVLKAMEHDKIPAQPAFGALNPHVESALRGTAIQVARETTSWPSGERTRLASISSFGFGGVNAHAVLEEPPARETRPRREAPCLILKLSGECPDALRAQARCYIEALSAQQAADASATDFCYSANTSRSDLRYREAVTGRSVEELLPQLEELSRSRELIAARKRPKLALLFPGQGRATLDTGRSLYEFEHVFRAAFDACAAQVDRQLTVPIAKALAGPIRANDVVQTPSALVAAFAVQYALSELLRSWGIKASAVYGCEIGEYAACCAAGVLSLEAALKLVLARARLLDVAGPELEFETVANSVQYDAPTLNIVCSLDGRVAEPGTLCAQYFVQQLRASPASGAALRALADQGVSVFLELGPGSALGTEAEHVVPDATFLEGMSAEVEPGIEDQHLARMYQAIGRVYGSGIAVDWPKLFGGERRQRVRVPTYPFQGRRHWIEFSAQPSSMAPAVRQRPVAVPVDHLSVHGGYRPSWELKSPGSLRGGARGRWVVLAVARELATFGAALTAKLQQAGCNARLVTSAQVADWYAPIGDGPVSGIVDLRSLSTNDPRSPELIAEAHERVVRAVEMVQAALRERALGQARLWLVTCDAQAIAPDERVDCFQTPLWGFGRTAELELPGRWGGLIDVAARDLVEPDALAQRVVMELLAAEGETQIALRGPQRFVARVAAATGGASPARLAQDGCYLVAGGLSTLGLQLAQRLVQAGARNLVLTSRRRFEAEPSELPALRAMGAQVTICVADVSTREGVAAAIECALSAAPLRGVVHVAGARHDTAIARMTTEAISSVLRPKLDGSWYLHEATRDRQLDFFVMYSSVASAFGSPGQANYAAANAFLDGLAQLRHSQGLPATSINWGPWGGGGMASELDEQARERLLAKGIRWLEPEAALDVFEGALSVESEPQLAVVDLDWKAFGASLPAGRDHLYFSKFWTRPPEAEKASDRPQQSAPERVASEVVQAIVEAPHAPSSEVVAQPDPPAPTIGVAPREKGGSSTLRRRLESESPEQRVKSIESMLVSLFAKALNAPESSIELDQDLDDQGMDSLLYMEILREIEEQLELALSPAELAAHTRVNRLARYLDGEVSAHAKTVGSQATAAPGVSSSHSDAQNQARPEAHTEQPASHNGSSGSLVPLRIHPERGAGAAAGRREQRYFARGRELVFLEWGPSTGFPVILLHGILDQALAWEMVAQGLAALGYRVIAPDLRGHGHSAHDVHAEGYSLLSFCADLADLIERLQIDRSIVVGHSLGSLVSVIYASCFMDKVEALVLVETMLLGALDRVDLRDQFKQDIEYMRGEHAHRPIPSIDVAVKLLRQASSSLSTAFARQLCERGTRQDGNELLWRWDPILRSRVGLRFPGVRAQYLEILRHLDLPVCLLFGRQSSFNRADEAEQLLRALPNARAESVEGGHNLHFDDPQSIVDAVLSLSKPVSERSRVLQIGGVKDAGPSH